MAYESPASVKIEETNDRMAELLNTCKSHLDAGKSYVLIWKDQVIVGSVDSKRQLLVYTLLHVPHAKDWYNGKYRHITPSEAVNFPLSTLKSRLEQVWRHEESLTGVFADIIMARCTNAYQSEIPEDQFTEVSKDEILTLLKLELRSRIAATALDDLAKRALAQIP